MKTLYQPVLYILDEEKSTPDNLVFIPHQGKFVFSEQLDAEQFILKQNYNRVRVMTEEGQEIFEYWPRYMNETETIAYYKKIEGFLKKHPDEELPARLVENQHPLDQVKYFRITELSLDPRS